MQTSAMQTSVASLRVTCSAQQRVAKGPVTRSLGLRPAQPAARREAMVVRASDRPADFDATLELVANKWEKTENKAVVGGYIVGATLAIMAAEWLMHLPLFNVLIGFPVQFVGLLTVVNLGVTRYVEKKGSLWDDAEQLVDNVTKQLPGLGK